MGRSLTVAILIALVLGIGLRCWDLDHKLFWVDEVYTTFNVAGYTNGEVAMLFHPPRLSTAQGLVDQITGSDRPFGAMLKSLITEDTTHVPLYYAITFVWVKLFGASVTALRAVAVACSVAALPLFYDLSQRLVPSRTKAGLAMALMAVSPFHLVYSQEARPYSLWMLITVLSSWALIRAVQQSGAPKSSWLHWGSYGVTASLGLYTFLYMPLVLLAHGLYVLMICRGRWCPKVHRYLWASLGAGVSFLPWLIAIAPYRDNLTGNTRWQVQAASQRPLALLHHLGLTLARGFIDFDVNYDFGLNRWWPYGIVILVIAALVAYGAIATIRHKPLEAWLLPILLLIVPALGIVAIEVGLGQQQSGIPRYFTPCYVGAELLVAYGLGQQIEQGASRLWSLVAIALLAIGALSCGNSALAETWWSKSGHYLPVVASAIEQSEAPFVLLDSDAWSFSLAYELPPETPMGLFNSGLATPTLPPGHSDYFLYNAPADWVSSFQQNSGYTLQPLEGLENVPFWRVIP
mgnify:CR=1 FL=1